MQSPFYGWIIVAVSFLIGFTESGVFQNIMSIFMKPMVGEFGWSRAAVTGAVAFGSLGGGLLSLWVGPLLDRHGPRMVCFWGVLLLSLGLGAMMFATEIWHLYLFFGGGRMIAIGVLGIAVSVSVANWFVRLRGRAMGITRIGDRLGSALLPLMVQYLILTLGWRMAWGALAAVVFLISGLPALIFLRHRPEQMGLRPDGAPSAAPPRTPDPAGLPEEPASGSERVWTRAEAIRTRTFRMLILLGILIPFAQAGMNFHIYPFLTDQGFSETTAVWILTTFAVSGMMGSAAWGILAERFQIERLLAVNVVANGLVSLLFFWLVQHRFHGAAGTAAVFALGALHGLCLGGRNPMFPLIWASCFGRRSLGGIYSLGNPFYFTANAIGPIFAGLFFDLFGSYAFPFYFFVAVFLLSGLTALAVRPPETPPPAAIRAA